MLENVPEYLFPKEKTPPPQPTVYGAEYYTDRLTLIQTVQKLALIIQQCIDSINNIDPEKITEFIALVESLSDEVATLSAEVQDETKKVADLSDKVSEFEAQVNQFAADVEKAVNDSAAAKALAESAETKANTAITTANDAVTDATNAKTLANTAVGTANAASAKADEAKTDAANAVTTANIAEDSALTATATANNAATAAANATTKADSAITTANAAHTTATEAKNTADTAATDAADAMTDAAEALTKANAATTTANTANQTATAADTKADTAVATATDAKNTADGIDAKATQAQTDAANALTKATSAESYAKSAVKTVNNIAPDENGNVNVAGGSGDVKTVNGVSPDNMGNVQLTYDTNLNGTSENAVQNKIVNAAITNLNNSAVKSVNGKLPVDGDVTVNIPPAITIDSQFNLTSTNPVQNKVVSAGINNLNDLKANKTELNTTDANLANLSDALTTLNSEAVKTVNGLKPINGNVNTVTDLELNPFSSNPIANSVVSSNLDKKGNVNVNLSTSVPPTVMSIINANTPLVEQTTGQEFYPLTAYSQVVMPDGNRWNGAIALQMDLIWENPKPTEEFGEQVISLPNLSNYKLFLIMFRHSTTEGYSYSTISPLNFGIQLCLGFKYFGHRGLTITNDSLNFQSAQTFTSYNSGPTTNNKACIPVYVYGLK